MKPLGRKYYKCKTGGKHSVKNSKKFPSWWENVCEPNKVADRHKIKLELKRLNNGNYK